MVDQLLADEQISSGTSGTVYWALTDHLGNVRDLATYSAGVTTIVDHVSFDSFGNVVGNSSSTVDTLFKFTGKYRDPDSGLQWNLNRWYDPYLGQWITDDPIGFEGGDENLRRYVGNGVLNLTDPL